VETDSPNRHLEHYHCSCTLIEQQSKPSLGIVSGDDPECLVNSLIQCFLGSSFGRAEQLSELGPAQVLSIDSRTPWTLCELKLSIEDVHTAEANLHRRGLRFPIRVRLLLCRVLSAQMSYHRGENLNTLSPRFTNCGAAARGGTVEARYQTGYTVRQ